MRARCILAIYRTLEMQMLFRFYNLHGTYFTTNLTFQLEINKILRIQLGYERRRDIVRRKFSANATSSPRGIRPKITK